MGVVAIGSSTGGPVALTELLVAIPAPFPVPILIAQHTLPVFTGALAGQLRARSKHRVEEARGGERLEPGTVWIAPGDRHLVVRREGLEPHTEVHGGERVNGCRPAVDELFRSVAEVYGRAAVVVVLTGMGKDGLEGCRAVRARGGRVIVQDQATSVVWGMPGQVARAGLADAVLALEQIGPELSRIALAVRPVSNMSGG